MECLFCRIVSGKERSAKIYEDDEFIAILDKYPNTPGVTLILTKKHYGSHINDLPRDVYERLMLTTRKVANILEEGLGVKRVAIVIEGMGIDHFHVKLYPLHGINKRFKEFWSREKVFFPRYEGFITTQLGPEKGIDELERLAETIRQRAGIKHNI